MGLALDLPPAALARELDRGRHDGDPEEHHRRARAGPAEGLGEARMNFGFSEEQELLRNTARKFFENECPSTFVRDRMAEPAGVTDEFWNKLAEQGWLGLIYPEEFGGTGLGFVDLTVLMEEMGRASMPGPFVSTVLLGGLAVLEAGSARSEERRVGKERRTGRVPATLEE